MFLDSNELKMNYSHLIFVFTIILAYSSVSILAQQPYFGTGTNDCSSQDTSTSAFGYLCNGVNRTCQSYLTFRSQPPFNTVSSISSLLGANPSQLSQLNSVSQNATFNTNQMVLVPYKDCQLAKLSTRRTVNKLTILLLVQELMFLCDVLVLHKTKLIMVQIICLLI